MQTQTLVLDVEIPGTPPRRCECPRCGYDLSGEVDTWSTQCPLQGRCPECGLDVDWARILNAALNAPPWSFEHADRMNARAFFATLARLVLPWRFWRAIDMQRTIRWPRLIAMNALALLLLHLTCATARSLEVGANILFNWISSSPVFSATPLDLALQFLRPFSTEYLPRPLAAGLVEAAPFALLWVALTAALIPLIRTTASRHGIRSRHAVRVALCGVCGALAVFWIAAIPSVGYSAFGVVERILYEILPYNAVRPLSTFAYYAQKYASQAIWIAAMLWPPLFWWAALRWHLRIRRPAVVSIGLSIISCILAGLTMLFLTGLLP